MSHFPCFPKEVDFACVVANYIRPKLLKHPLKVNQIDPPYIIPHSPLFIAAEFV
jgi:hypothetical protein